MEEIDWGRQSRTISAALTGSHLAGAVFVFAYLSQLAPIDSSRHGSLLLDVIVFVGYALVAFPVTGLWCDRTARRDLRWVWEDRTLTEDERDRTITLPGRMAAITATPWAVAAVFFA